ncbi:MAG: efflux RND transporter periplasmic adaptor subunit [Muribaculaceae bacterium]
MKFQYILVLSASMLFGFTGCHKEANELAHHHHEHSHESHNHEGEEHDHDHEGEGHDHDHAAESAKEKENHDSDVIVLSPEAAKRMGVATDTVSVSDFNQVIKVSGRIMPDAGGDAVVSAPTSGILRINKNINVGSEVKAGTLIGSISADGVSGGDANRTAKVNLEAAKAEFDRVSALYADRLVTLAQYNAARAELDRAKAAYSAPAASGRATAPISGIITALNVKSGQFVETGTPIATVASSTQLTLRADVPFKHYREASAVTDARIVVPSTGTSVKVSDLGGRRADSGNPSAGASGGYVPVTFSLRNDGSLIPGSAVEVYLIGNSSTKAVTVPVSALVEQQGSLFVFIRLDEDCYRKVPVVTGRSNGSEVEILSGLSGGESVVSAGTTAVKLAQSSGNVPEGHSHSH